jgi:RNA polymerase sigma-70 factor, ECF subfamily
LNSYKKTLHVSDKEKLFEQIVQENRDRLYRICRACMPDQDDANDLYQEVLVKV